jgi:hypothetical protein
MGMRYFNLLLISLFVSVPTYSQSTDSNDAMLSKARGLYDAPFTRQLVSVDCSVRFDWKEHFISTVGMVPTAALPTVNRLQSLQHRVFVDRTGAIVSVTPKAPDLSSIPHAADLEVAFQAMVTSGLNAWLPFSTNVILPVKPTTFTFQPSDTGFKVVMKGTNVSATLDLLPDMRIKSVISELPQPQHFVTEFETGPDGYIVQSVKTGAGTDLSTSWNAIFAYRYQNIQGFQIPVEVAVTQVATGEKWDYSLVDCKSVTGTVINVQAPEK